VELCGTSVGPCGTPLESCGSVVYRGGGKVGCIELVNSEYGKGNGMYASLSILIENLC